MKLAPQYALGSYVFLRVTAERKGMVTGYIVRPGGVLIYIVRWDEPLNEETEHYACELTDQKPLEGVTSDSP